MQVRLPQGLDPEMAARFPKERKEEFELLFGADQSLWRNLPKAENPDVMAGGGGTMIVRSFGSNDVIYHNFTTGKRLDKREMFDKEFLVEDNINKLSWKLTGEMKSILGHPAQKAVAQRISPSMRTSMENGEMKRVEVQDTSAIVAWFTTDFPVQAGPQELQGQLPGLILEVDVNNGRQVYRAIEISPKVSVSSIKEPKGGKRISGADYAKERDKMMEEMQKNMPPGGRMQIRMN
jgi:GLPGLI family protein